MRKGICRFIAVLVLTSIISIDKTSKLTPNKPQAHKRLKSLRSNTLGTKRPHLYYNSESSAYIILLYFVRCSPDMRVTVHNRTHKIDPKIRECISDLESLAIEPKRINELNDVYEMEHLVDNIKLNLYQDFRSDETEFRA